MFIEAADDTFICSLILKETMQMIHMKHQVLFSVNMKISSHKNCRLSQS